jgi:uncharacterized membrane protein
VTVRGDPVPEPADSDDEVTFEALLSELDGLASDATSRAMREEIDETRDLLALATDRGLIDSGVRRLDPADAAEAVVGSVIFASPLLVEDGVFDIAAHLFQFTVAGVPVFLLVNTLFVVVLTYALLEWTGRDETETHTLFGVFPVRVLMTLVVSAVVAAVLMTAWGRVTWGSPVEAVARINVLWTVGSIGAALGDILAEDDPIAAAPRRATADADVSDAALVASIYEEFDDLESVAGSAADRREVRTLRVQAVGAAAGRPLGRRIRKYTTRDVAEAFVGSVVFSIPFLVEDGVFDIAAYFLSFRIGQFPVFFTLNAAFVLGMVAALVYWAGPQDVTDTRPLFGVVPRRLIGISVVSFLTAAALMTTWGRVAWATPTVAVARISVVWTVASFGAALGDVLPGESSGDDIADIADFGELFGDD